MSLPRTNDQIAFFDIEKDAIDSAYSEKTALLESLNLRRRERMSAPEMRRAALFGRMVDEVSRSHCGCPRCELYWSSRTGRSYAALHNSQSGEAA